MSKSEPLYSLRQKPRLLYKYYPINKELCSENMLQNLQLLAICPHYAEKESSFREKWEFIILDGWLFYTCPIFFNDKFDTPLPTSQEVKPTLDARKAWIKILKKHLKILKLDVNRLLLSDNFEDSYQHILANYQLSPLQKQTLTKELTHNVLHYRDELCISCFTENYNVNSMWGDYADGFTGVCIEYDFRTAPLDFQKSFIKVRYSDTMPQQEENETTFHYQTTLIATKHSSWARENEWRTINFNSYLCTNKQLYFRANLKKFITAIYIGFDTENEICEKIIAHYKNTSVKIYKMKPQENSFECCFDLIESV